MTAKIIKNQHDYDAAMARIDELMDAVPGSAENEELDLLAALVEAYENKHFPIDLPDPIAAIRFRMDQQDLAQQDLVQFIGSRSKVSEVLNGKRPLSLAMIRALHTGLGIPAEVLLKEPGAEVPKPLEHIDCATWPIREMTKRGWFAGIAGVKRKLSDDAEDLVRKFLAPLGGSVPAFSLNRQHVRAGSKMDENALKAWRARVLILAKQQQVAKYRPNSITKDFMRQLVGLSCLNNGPMAAQELLAKSGIPLVIERHLPKTHLDGAAILDSSGAPVVALTLRHDRLDNFWFTICHELAHVALHLGPDRQCFFDDLDVSEAGLEREADIFAGDALIPKKAWEAAQVRQTRKAEDAIALATQLRISPSIIAGRIRREESNYRLMSNLVGQGTVRSLFGQAA